mmetsp:Transcript_17140/g.24228  ORF Transcript_17140/g.24228 Transcript_17140/m.24228 type:complete len:133 (+) Transcript_17140:3448-3846(+)
MNTVIPLFAHKLTVDQKIQALDIITLVKLKRCVKLKARTCATGKKQRLYMTKEEVSLPTAQLETMLLSMVIDAHKGRYVATADMVGAYLKTFMTDEVIVKFTGKKVELMCKVNKDYERYMTIQGKEKSRCYT